MKFEENFRFILPGLNLRPTEINAIAGIEQLKKINKFILSRRKNYFYLKNISEKDNNFIIQEEVGKSSWFGFSLIINNKKIKRNNLINYLKKYGIETRPIVCGNIIKSEMIKYFLIFLIIVIKNYYNSDFINKNGFFYR